MDPRLSIIKDYLDQCGINAEIRSDRKDMYINVGDVKHVKNRMQFWTPKYGDGVDMYVGTEMGNWYNRSCKSIYVNTTYRYSFKENMVSFPNVNMAKQFISEVTGK